MSLLIYLPLLPKPGGEGVNLSRTSTIEARLVTNKNIVQGKNLLTMIFGNGWFSMQSIAEKNLEGHAKIADNIFVLVFDYTGIIGKLHEIFLNKLRIFCFQNIYLGYIEGKHSLLAK